LKKKARLRYAGPRPGDVFTTFADIEKAKKLIKYDPETSIEEGLGYFIDWYKEKSEEGILSGPKPE